MGTRYPTHHPPLEALPPDGVDRKMKTLAKMIRTRDSGWGATANNRALGKGYHPMTHYTLSIWRTPPRAVCAQYRH